MITSPLCTFCEQENESLEHLFITCTYTTSFWLDFICWCKKIDIDLKELSNTDILLGIWQTKEDFLLLNHLLILAKQYIYECRKKMHPSFLGPFGVFTNKEGLPGGSLFPCSLPFLPYVPMFPQLFLICSLTYQLTTYPLPSIPPPPQTI